MAVALVNAAIYLRHPSQVVQFRGRMGYFPNVGAPATKNEKFLWRKVFDRNPLYRLMTDKLAVRQIVRSRCPDLDLTEIVWTGRTAEEVPDALLRPGVVVKTNNGSSRNIFIGDEPVDRAALNTKVAAWLRTPYGARHGQWAYDSISPAVFVELVVAPPAGHDLLEISCHVTAGRCVVASLERNVKKKQEQMAFFDPAGKRHPSQARSTMNSVHSTRVDELPVDVPLPSTFRRAVACAEAIGRDCDYLRVDFMCAGDSLYFCECTIFPVKGFSTISGGIDELIAASWDLRNAWFMHATPTGLQGFYARAYRTVLDSREQRNSTEPQAPRRRDKAKSA